MPKILFFCKWCQTNKYGSLLSDETPRPLVRVLSYRCAACERITNETFDKSEPLKNPDHPCQPSERVIADGEE